MSSETQADVIFNGDINSQATMLAYYGSLVRGVAIPVAAALALATVQFLVLRRDVLVFSAALLLSLGFGAFVIRSGRRSAANVLSQQAGANTRFFVVAVPASFGLWRLAGGTGRGGWFNEWVLMTSDGRALLARGTAEHQVRAVNVEVREAIATHGRRIRLSAANRSCTVLVRTHGGPRATAARVA